MLEERVQRELWVEKWLVQRLLENLPAAFDFERELD